MGSDSDKDIAKAAGDTLEGLGIPCEIRVLSAHRTPDQAVEYARTAEERGVKVIIGIAGMAAHLAGVLASNTLLPVLGVPAGGGLLGGLDALLSTVQMPPGVPVGTVAVGKAGGANAAYLAARIIGVSEPVVQDALKNARDAMKERVLNADRNIQGMGQQ
jgi:phosphoribosylamine--glycine ligase